MKKIIASALFLITATSFAETCTVVMRDYYGTQVNTFTRYSYSYDAACSEAQIDCKQDMAERQVNGGWYGLTCLELSTPPSYPAPYPTPYPPSYPPSYPTPYPPSYPPSYPTPYPGPSYPTPLPPREPHWPSEPPRYPDPGRDGHGDGGWGHDGGDHGGDRGGDRGGPGRR